MRWEAETMMAEQEPRIVDSFAVLDMDRTMLDSDKLLGLLAEALIAQGIARADIEEDVNIIVDATGQSISPLEFFIGEYGRETVHQATQSLHEAAEVGALDDAELIYKGVEELLDEFDRLNVPYCIVTYGEQLDQDFKLQLVRTLLARQTDTLPGIITSRKFKASWMGEEWFDEATGHVVPAQLPTYGRYVAKQLVIIDDKQENLETEAAHVRGVLIDNGSPDASIAWLVRQLKAGKLLSDIAANYPAETSNIDKV